MSSSSGPVLVVGATGQQGGSVIRALQALPSPPKICALSRNPNSPAAEKLRAQGIEVVKGTLTDKSSLVSALTGAGSAFLVTTIPGKGARTEVEQGVTFIDAAKETSLPFLVYTSVSDISPTCGIPHFETKAKVEEALNASGIKNTVVAPVAFYDNFPKTPGLGTFALMGVFDAALQGKKLQMVAVEDIGYLAAQALADPAKHAGRRIKLAGDELTMEEVRQTYERVEGRGVWKAWIPGFVTNFFPHDFGSMLRFFYEKGFSADPKKLRKEYPGLRTFQQWLEEGKKKE
ncbi:hypothetical protein JCM6882_001064 [Rhodosporidiobolus microsporus]